MALARMPSMAEMLGVRDQEDFGPSGCPAHPDRALELDACQQSFRHFLPHWRFINRETGEELTFRTLWDGQARIAESMETNPWLIILKAGKLGASELECAYDGWQLRFGGRNRRVHLFSMDRLSATGMLDIVKYGTTHLPEYMLHGFTLMSGEAGGDNSKQMMWRAGRDDVRRIITYAPTKNASIDQSAHHTHCDELSRMPFPTETWSAVDSTVAPGGSVHIVSRGNGADNEMTDLWNGADQPGARFVRIFEPYDSRPRFPESAAMKAAVERGEIDPMAAWYAEQEIAIPTKSQLWYFAPRTPAEALAGAQEDAYIDVSRFDACYVPDLPRLVPGDPIPVVIALDAGVSSDLFAAVIGSRDPRGQVGDVDYGDRAALRAYQTWHPEQQEGGVVDFAEVERWVRMVCVGGCTNGHPNRSRQRLSEGQMCSVHAGQRQGHGECEAAGEPCWACEQNSRVPRMNVVEITYDRYELVDMMQRLEREHIVACEPFDQGAGRTTADTEFHRLLLTRELSHPFDPNDADNEFRQHIQNAVGKIPSGDDNRVRIEKRTQRSKVDLAVAGSMCVDRVLFLNIKPRRAA